MLIYNFIYQFYILKLTYFRKPLRTHTCAGEAQVDIDYTAKAVPTKTYKGAREGPQKVSVLQADVLINQPCSKRPPGFRLDDQPEMNAPLKLAEGCAVWVTARFRATWVMLLGYFFSNLPSKLHVCGELFHIAYRV